MSDYPMLISNKLHSFRNFIMQSYKKASYQNALRLIIILYPYCKIFASPFLLLKSTKRDGSKAVSFR